MEINPFGETPDGRGMKICKVFIEFSQRVYKFLLCILIIFHFSVVCFDAKINFDDNAAFRQKEVFAMDDMAETDPREIEASRLKLNYIALEGSIGCLGLCLFKHYYNSKLPFKVTVLYVYVCG